MTKTQLALAIEQTKFHHKQHEGKDAKKGKAEQVTYDAGMTKIAQSLVAQLKDVSRAFCLEVWGEAFNAARVDVESDLRGADTVYYPLALRIALSSALPPPNPSSASSAPNSTITSTITPIFRKKKKEQQTPTPVVELEPEEVVEVEQLKWKKKDKEKDVTV